MDKPSDIFDRDTEWSALSAFAADSQPGATLGIFSGRRRQGKTFLLQALCQQTGGFYFGATEATDAESLRRIGEALAEHLQAPAAFRPSNWHEVVDALLALGRDGPVPVVLDELPYLVKSNPALPSIIQDAFAPLREQRTSSQTRLLLCGSVLSVMGKLLSAHAPLRGRAGLELVLHPFDHQEAAEFWGISDPGLALRVNAIVGGTPAYRREFVRDDVPSGPDDFDDWVIRTVLNPATALFREARYLLSEEPDVRDISLYHSALAAIAEGNSTRGGIANYLGRQSSDIAHPLNVLEDAGLLSRDVDAFRANRTTFRITEPLITFYQAVMRPVWDQLTRPGMGSRVWQTRRRQFDSQVLGPRFEQICRNWAMFDAPPDLMSDLPARVGSGVVNDPANQTSHQVDVVLVGVGDGRRAPLLALGEARWHEVMGVGQLERLRRIKSLIGRYDTSSTKLVCYSGAGFTSALQNEAEDSDVVLVGLEDLYHKRSAQTSI